MTKVDHKRKFEVLNEEEKSDTHYKGKPVIILIVRFIIKYGRIVLFITGLGLFFVGLLGEILGFDGYTFYSTARFTKHGVKTEPYWFSCIYGMGFMLLAIRRKWLINLFRKK